MSKNILDAIVEINSDIIGILPTRRQIDYNGGYVNNWNTVDFFNYLSNNFVVERDHGGINQGVIDDDGYESFKVDSKYFNIFHIDPWKKYKNFTDGISETIKYIKFIYSLNPNVYFEVGTEEDIRKFEMEEIDSMLKILKNELSEEMFNRILYVSIQSGVSLDLVYKKNNGIFNEDKFKTMIDICNIHNKKSKEHNGDFLNDEEHKFRFDNGLSSINIGPELAIIETFLYLEHMTNKEIDNFYNICLKSEKWKRWIKTDINLIDKKTLIQTCGHYNYLSINLPKIDDLIKKNIKNKINNLLKI